jgi:hypothetical protein
LLVALRAKRVHLKHASDQGAKKQGKDEAMDLQHTRTHTYTQEKGAQTTFRFLIFFLKVIDTN